MSLFVASRIFKGWIGGVQIWRVFRRIGHYSRSVEFAGTLSQAAGELGPLGLKKKRGCNEYLYFLFERERNDKRTCYT